MPIKNKLSWGIKVAKPIHKFVGTYNRCIISDQGIRIDQNSAAVKDIKDPLLMGRLVRGVDDGLVWKLSNTRLSRFRRPLQCNYRLSRF